MRASPKPSVQEQCPLLYSQGWLDSGALRFVFDGETVAGTLSPRDLDLEGDEVIEAYPL